MFWPWLTAPCCEVKPIYIVRKYLGLHACAWFVQLTMTQASCYLRLPQTMSLQAYAARLLAECVVGMC